ncbi:MAG: AMMECR1 domain-containing protein [Candidatus Micrarchaeota archaeon]|nr:MAG: AMMECR1 domain-containing protein [Candidatus Micrarchaeota archaeon]
MKELSLEDGKRLVKLSRSIIADYLRSSLDRDLYRKEISKIVDEKLGVFVTLRYFSDRSLRGCIGYPFPSDSVAELLIDASIAAATEDPRFMPLSYKELDKINVEVSLLSEMQEIDKSNISREVVIGKDGLYLQYLYRSALFLPEVPIEEHWNLNQYLENLCYKAGLPADTWKKEKAKLFRFQTIIFAEIKPNGAVKRINLDELR